MTRLEKPSVVSALTRRLGLTLLIVFAGSGAAYAQNGSAFFFPRTWLSAGAFTTTTRTISWWE
jgi:hypothetical protein